MASNTSSNGNILLVANWESNVGYAWWLMENFWVSISQHFDKQDMKCFLAYPKITTIPDSIAATQIKTTELNFANHSFKHLKEIFKLIKSKNIRHIYLSDAVCNSWFYLFLRLCGIRKIIVHDHTPGDRQRPAVWLRLIKKIRNRIPFYNADHFIAVTDFVHRRHIEVNCLPKKKCSTANNGIIPLDLSSADKDYAQTQFNIPDDKIIVVTTGRASYYKGIDFFILCADELINKNDLHQFHFLFCGDGADLPDFIELCQQLNLEDHCTFAGKRDDVKKILPSCHIGFHTSKGEVGYSLSILEYMSAGLVTIVPDRPSTSNATKHEKTGLIYKHADINSACTSIKRCLDDELRQKIANNAIKEIFDRYRIQQTNKALIKILDAVLIE